MKFALVVAALLASSVAAFAPVAQKSTFSTSLQAADGKFGALPPLGAWDPLGLLEYVLSVWLCRTSLWKRSE